MARVSAPALLNEKPKAPAAAAAEKPAPAKPAQSRRKRPAATPGKEVAKPAKGTQQAPQAPETPAPAAKAAPARAAARAGDPPPLPKGDPGEKRITLPMWQSAHRALALARVDDEVDTTVRIRAMIELWMHDDRFRQRVDKLAKQRSGTLHRGRPRTRG